MPYHTDERLKSYLDTNQLSREQLCLAVLAIDRRFSDVRPRHPRGGPDGGADIEALFEQKQLAMAAVGFVNQANDSTKQKRQIARKFREDVKSALDSAHQPEVFVFMTNVNLTRAEREDLVCVAKAQGLKFCDVMDRERLRIALDSPDGLAIRFQYLGLALSEPEQASFFAKWGNDINSVIATGFQGLERKLDRILFLQEASEVLTSLHLVFQLSRAYAAKEVGHFRAFTVLFLKEPKLDIFSILFGSSDRAKRMDIRSVSDLDKEPPGIEHGISGGQWESYIKLKNQRGASSKRQDFKYECVLSSSAVGMKSAEFIPIRYDNGDSFLRIFPRLRLVDLNDANFTPILNRSLASKLKAVHVYANGYKIQELNLPDFVIDPSSFGARVPMQFTQDELKDSWVRIRPNGVSSSFHISFSNQTPKRLFDSPIAPDSLTRRKRE